jgi:tetratricopeptide (TPR) repeat protein
VARRADPDPWRDRVRDPAAWDDPAALARLASAKEAADQSPHLLAALANRLPGGERERLLQRAQERHPEDFWLNFDLGDALQEGKKPGEAVGYYRAALALRPGTYAVYINLGNALRGQGKVDEAISHYRQAIDIDPRNAQAHTNLGAALRGQGKVDEAIGECRKAIALDPRNALAHYNLGAALRDKGKVDEAIGEYRQAIALDPRYAQAHYNLGVALRGQGKVDEAIGEYRQAIAFDPKYAQAHYNLGIALYGKGRRDEAIACFQKAVEIDPKLAEAHCNLGDALRSQGRLAESLESYRRGHALGSKRPGWSYPSLRWVRQARRLVRREKDLPDVLSGKRRPTGAERIEYAGVCTLTKRYQSAARLYAEAFTADPTLADDLQAAHRYDAARAAALAAAGQGKEAPKPDDKERARLRRQALGWLRADLALWGREAMKATPQARATVQKTLRHWQKDPDLAGVRQADTLEKLPEAERADWKKLWGEVAALLKK